MASLSAASPCLAAMASPAPPSTCTRVTKSQPRAAQLTSAKVTHVHDRPIQPAARRCSGVPTERRAVSSVPRLLTGRRAVSNVPRESRSLPHAAHEDEASETAAGADANGTPEDGSVQQPAPAPQTMRGPTKTVAEEARGYLEKAEEDFLQFTQHLGRALILTTIPGVALETLRELSGSRVQGWDVVWFCWAAGLVLGCMVGVGEVMQKHQRRRAAACLPPRRVVLTGGSRGLGKAMAREFLLAGDDVLLASRSEKGVEEALRALQQDTWHITGRAPMAVLVKTGSSQAESTQSAQSMQSTREVWELPQAHGGDEQQEKRRNQQQDDHPLLSGRQRVVGIVCDVRLAKDVQMLADVARQELGRVDIWVNNAGTNPMAKPFVDFEDHELEQVVSTNLLGSLLCTRAAMRLMQQQQPSLPDQTSGHVFNLEGAGSWGGATPQYAAYGATKCALRQPGASLVEEGREVGGERGSEVVSDVGREEGEPEEGRGRRGRVGVHAASPGLVLTDLLLSGATVANKQAFNIVGEHPETVARVLVPQVKCGYVAKYALERIVDDPVFRYAIQCFARAGPGYVPPKRGYVGGVGLKKVRQKMEAALAPVAASWKRDGVTVSSDMMTDRCGRPQANILLVNDSGAVFEQAVDCNMESKTGGYIASLLRPVIDKVGPENVVAVCTDWRQQLCIGNVGKMGWAKGLVEKGGEMITFVRNHHFTRAYMKKVGGKQVLKPAGTRFGTQYIAMARLCEVRSGLAAMVLSDEWKVWAAGDKDRKTAAEKFRAAVMDEEWWGVAEFFSSLMAVPFKAMRATDSSAKGMMGAARMVPLAAQEALLAYINLEGSFGKLSAIAAREAVKKGEMSMVQWWSWHSTEYPELATLACRILTQPVSASSCERGWAQWEGVHTARRNRLGSAKCADLVYIAHYWNVVRNWYNKDGASTVVPGNIPDAPIPRGYNMDEEEEDDLLGGEGDDAVLADEYGEGVVVEKPRKEIGWLVLTDLLLSGATVSNKQAFNIVGEHPETVACVLVPQVLSQVVLQVAQVLSLVFHKMRTVRGTGSTVSYLTPPRIVLAILSAWMRRGRWFDQQAVYATEAQRLRAWAEGKDRSPIGAVVDAVPSTAWLSLVSILPLSVSPFTPGNVAIDLLDLDDLMCVFGP
ncbi:unnamed protein product [Closterium sp. Naga37s-1]|nr:unnamed protein product [Closterium sp. Naga37s-1]